MTIEKIKAERATIPNITERGYRPEPDISSLIKEFSVPDLVITMRTIFLDHVLILVSGLAAYNLLQYNVLLMLLAWPLLLVLAGRSLRGLECLVHEASHFNFTRKHKMNDLLANILCAWPVLSEVEKYRTSHLVHHRSFGHEADPDRVRNEALSLEDLDRSSRVWFILGVAKRIVPYVPGWWWAIGMDATTVGKFVAWHAIIFWFPTNLVVGPYRAATLWLLTWGIPVFFVLPIIRFVAEAAEHDYSETKVTGTVFTRTWSNVGWIHTFVFHPHNDGYHAIHHLYPSVPHHALKRLHEQVVKRDGTFAHDALIRTKVAGIDTPN
ncbi:fatty acid desaturase family protein [Notoacmeibacter marinus]|uniref:fatty acid desaturase family protein n=1 Tax=Notoacmeibacter marinus TaxID=1876515 RepID=UPI000DF116E3|nr:fatty acid desaturase family protein [Notoacmeibacter marinus]